MTKLEESVLPLDLKAGLYALVLAVFLLSLNTNSFAVPDQNKSGDKSITSSAKEKVEEKKQDQTTAKRKEIISDAVLALEETHKALKALDDDKKKEALSSLEKATGKLEIILARDPALALAPTSVDAVTYDVLGSVEVVKETIESAEDYLEDGKVQHARRLIKGLASETVIRTHNLPLATYPAAIKSAVALIDDDKINEAKTVLQTALNTLVVTETVLPLPIVTAKALLQEAETLAEQKDRKDEQNKRIKSLLNEAQTKIELAQVLGYGTKKDFKEFHEELYKIRNKTSDGKSGLGLFAKIKKSMTSMFDSSQAPEEHSSEN